MYMRFCYTYIISCHRCTAEIKDYSGSKLCNTTCIVGVYSKVFEVDKLSELRTRKVIDK